MFATFPLDFSGEGEKRCKGIKKYSNKQIFFKKNVIFFHFCNIKFIFLANKILHL